MEIPSWPSMPGELATFGQPHPWKRSLSWKLTRKRKQKSLEPCHFGQQGTTRRNPFVPCLSVPDADLVLLRLRLAVAFSSQHHAKQTIHKPCASICSADRYVGNNPDIAFAHNLHELHHRVALRAQRFHAYAIRFGFGFADCADRSAFAQTSKARGFALTRSLLNRRIRLQFGDANTLFSTDNLLLNVRERRFSH